MIDALRPTYRLSELLRLFSISKSSDFYSAHALAHDKYAEIRSNLHTIFESVAGRYGYRRIHATLKRPGITFLRKSFVDL